MTKLAKRILVVFCSFVLAACLGAVGALWLNTNKSVVAKAATPTVTFEGVDANQNNVQWGTGRFIGVFLNFSADFSAHSELVSDITYTPDGGTATPFDYTWASFGGLGSANQLQLLINGLTPIADGAVLHIPNGTVVGGQVLPEVTLYMENGKWQAPVTFEGVDANQNNVQWGTGRFIGVFLNFSADFSAHSELVSDITYTPDGGTATPFDYTWASFGGLGSANQLQLLINGLTPIANGAVLHIPNGTVVGGQELPEVTLYMVNGKWSEEPAAETPTQSVAFTEFSTIYNNGTYPWGDGLYVANVLYFDKPLYSEPSDSTSVISVGELATNLTINGKTAHELDIKITFAVLSESGRNGLEFYFLKKDMPKFSEEVRQIVLEIKEGTKFLNNALSSPKFYLNAEGKWQTEEYTHVYVPPQEVTLTEVGADHNNVQNPWRDEYYLSAFVFEDSLSQEAVNDGVGLLGEKLELNGVKTSELGFLFSTTASSATMNVQYPKTAIPTLSETLRQVKLELVEAVEFGNVILQPFTLYLNELNKWQIEEYSYVPPQEVTFAGFSEKYNNGIYPFGDGAYSANVLYFNAPLYAEVMDTARVELVKGDLATNLTINGVTAKDLGIAVTFTVLSEAGRNGLEFYFLKANMPKFEKDGDQIILEIKEGTTFLNNVLPALKFYLNAYEEWQTEEYSYEYQPIKEITLVEVSVDYNNHQNPWRDEHYLSAFVFSDILSKKAVDDGVGLLGEKLELNGVKTSELGFLFSTTEYSTMMNVQYPKESLHSVINANRQVRLVLTEAVAFGDVIIQPFRLYWNENRWELIDETDKTAPVIVYEGEREINTSAEKPFVIQISAFDNENDLACAIYYDWSAGALDEGNKLIKGTHTCTITAIDVAGNVETLVLTVNVGDKDTEKPEITAPDSITVYGGAIPELEYTATDNMEGEILCEVSWSEGALDDGGRLVIGTHTMTLTATDLTGNQETKTVTVVVTSVDVSFDDAESDEPSSDIPDGGASGGASDSSDDSSGVTSESDSASASESTGGCFGGIQSTVSVILAMTVCAGLLAVRRKKDNL